MVRRAALIATLAAAACGALAAPAQAAPPTVSDPWASGVLGASAKVSGVIETGGLETGYHFDYLTEVAYEANLKAGEEAFASASRAPKIDLQLPASPSPVTVTQTLLSLKADTAYRYRLRATNSQGAPASVAGRFITRAPAGGPLLADGRAWELVSPVQKNGGQVDPPEAIRGGGVLQAAADGESVTYGSAASFGAAPAGAPPGSQYIARRGSGGWATQNVTVPLFSGSYGDEPLGVPYRLFSTDLARALVLNGLHCRGEAGECPVANPPLAGTDAPAGYQNYYLRENGSGGFEALLGSADVAALSVPPAQFDLTLAGSSPDLRHVALSSCAALAPGAIEVPAGEGCDPTKPNLYLWSEGGLSAVNLLPGQGQSDPGAELAAPAGAVSDDGSHVYWKDLSSGNLYLRAEGETKQVDTAAGGGGSFEAATPDGSQALYTKAAHLYRYSAATGASTDLTPSGGVIGVLGISADGSHIYYLRSDGLFLRRGAETIEVAASADASNHPPASGAARVSADGTKLAFLATEPLTGYDNLDAATGVPQSQVYLYDADADELTCASCNPTLGRPLGPSRIAGAPANGTAAINPHKPRALSTDGRRLFFESGDALVTTDTNNETDVYQWEQQGAGDCTRVGGCVSLISSGRAPSAAHFIDASSDGADVFFLTSESLIGQDPGSVDLYVARIGGGFPVPEEPIPCKGNACQGLLSEPVDPSLNTLLAGLGNPPIRYKGERKPCPKGKVRRGDRCIKKQRPAAKRRRGGSSRNGGRR